MTTHVSRERREAAAKAITDARLRIAGNDTRNMALVLADAACATCLPDRAAFERGLDRLIFAAIRTGEHPNPINDHALMRQRSGMTWLVYGDDDAQAGEVE